VSSDDDRWRCLPGRPCVSPGFVKSNMHFGFFLPRCGRAPRTKVMAGR